MAAEGPWGAVAHSHVASGWREESVLKWTVGDGPLRLY